MRTLSAGLLVLLCCGAPANPKPTPLPVVTSTAIRSTLAFSIRDGETENRFVRGGGVAAHVLVTSGNAPRVIVAFPAGNAGIGLWFDGPCPEAAVQGDVIAIERADGMRGVGVTLRMRKGLRIKTALMGSVRALRQYGHDGKIPPDLKNAVAIGSPVTLRRTTLDDHHLEVSLDRAEGADGALSLAADVVKLEALSDETPLSPLTAEAILTPAAADDGRARDALAFLSYEQKLLAGSWQYLTYFGRDTLLSTRLLLPVLKPVAVEAALGAVIERLSVDGEVAHEEDVGEWAVAENAMRSPKPADLRQPVFDYKMVDDDFLLAPVVAAYLETPEGRERAAAFFARTASGRSYAEMVRKNIERVLAQAAPFAKKPTYENLVHIGQGLNVGNWRDSNEGLGGGRIPYDVNAALVPAALRAAEQLYRLPAFGADEALSKRAGELASAWTKAEPMFTVKLDAAEAQKRLAAYSAEARVESVAIEGPLSFPALALDGQGKPIPIEHSDDGFVMMFTEPSAEWLVQSAARIVNRFPLGLRTPVGIVVANPAFAPDPALRETFSRDHYHGTVVWSWQQAMLLAGVRRQLARPALAPKARHALDAAEDTLTAVIDATRAQRTKELWSFTTDAQGYHVVPYGQGHREEANAVQLWSTVFLALDKRVER